MRYILSDGYNSFWHFIFGYAAVYLWYIIPVFVAYQLLERNQRNTVIDLSEFLIGYVTASALCLYAPYLCLTQ